MTDNESEALSKLVEAVDTLDEMVAVLAGRVSRLEKDANNMRRSYQQLGYPD